MTELRHDVNWAKAEGIPLETLVNVLASMEFENCVVCVKDWAEYLTEEEYQAKLTSRLDKWSNTIACQVGGDQEHIKQILTYKLSH